MPNYKLLLEYNGSKFAGSQKLTDRRTVQKELENALSSLLKEEIKTTFAGRTDRGVHALGQVVNFKTKHAFNDLPKNSDKTLITINSALPSDMAVVKIESVKDNFHARFDAIAREYEYKIFIRKHRPVLRLDSLMWVKESLNFDAMSKQADSYLGSHDFAVYASSQDKKDSTVCTVYESELKRESAVCFKYRIKANRFLRNMVRRIVGELIYVGKGNRADIDSKRFSASAKGLTLIKVYY